MSASRVRVTYRMDLRDIHLLLARSFAENRLRAGLTVIGVVIGVGSVLLLVAIGAGVREDITRQVDKLGSNVAIIVPGKLSSTGQPDGMSMLGISSLTVKDVDDLSRIAGVRAAIPISFVTGSVETGNESHAAMVLGADHRMASVGTNRIARGRFYRGTEDSERVCVLGAEIGDELVGKKRLAGRTISVRGVPFRIVGILARDEESAFAQVSFARAVYIPWQASRTAFNGAQINRIIVQTDYQTDPDTIAGSLQRVLLRNHGREDFGVLTYRKLLGAIYHVFNIVTALIIGISAISLLVAGIGIMNVMLVTVTERTREIGIRMAMGARRSDIFSQFLAEAIALSLTGGVLGVALAFGVSRIVDVMTTLHPIITPGAILLAFGVCVIVGIVFGTAPAVRASRLSPVDALRFE